MTSKHTEAVGSIAPGTKEVKARVQIISKTAGTRAPRGAEELLSDFLTRCAYGHHSFRVTMLAKRQYPLPGHPGTVSINPVIQAGAVEISAQPGDGDTRMSYLVYPPEKVLSPNFLTQLQDCRGAFNARGNVSTRSIKNSDSNAPETDEASSVLRDIMHNEDLIKHYLMSLWRLYGESDIPKGCTAQVVADPESNLQDHPINSIRRVVGECAKLGYLERLYFQNGKSPHVSGYKFSPAGIKFLAQGEDIPQQEDAATPSPAAITLGSNTPRKLRKALEPHLATINAAEECEEQLEEARATVRALERKLRSYDKQLSDPKVQESLKLLADFQLLEEKLAEL